MQNKLIKLALIGCGRIAGHHFKSIKNYKMIKIIAVCDLKKKKHKNIQKNIKFLILVIITKCLKVFLQLLTFQ